MSRIDRLIAIAIGLCVALFFAQRIGLAVARSTADNAVFGADHAENLRALAAHRYWALGYAKHSAAVVWALLTIVPAALLRIDSATAAIGSFALALGIGHAAQYLYLRLTGVARLGSAALVLLTVSAYHYVTAASVIDIYGLTVAAIFVGLFLARRYAAGSPIIAGLCAAGAGLVNIPSAAYAIAFAQERAQGFTQRTRWVSAAIASAVAVTVSAVPLGGFALFTRAGATQRAIVEQWASFAHFIDRVILSDFATTLFATMLISPWPTLHCRYVVADWAGYFADPLRLAALLGWWLLIGAGVMVGLRRADTRAATLATMLSAAGITAFYIYFAPQAFELTSVQLQPAIMLLIVPAVLRAKWLASALSWRWQLWGWR